MRKASLSITPGRSGCSATQPGPGPRQHRGRSCRSARSASARPCASWRWSAMVLEPGVREQHVAHRRRARDRDAARARRRPQSRRRSPSRRRRGRTRLLAAGAKAEASQAGVDRATTSSRPATNACRCAGSPRSRRGRSPGASRLYPARRGFIAFSIWRSSPCSMIDLQRRVLELAVLEERARLEALKVAIDVTFDEHSAGSGKPGDRPDMRGIVDLRHAGHPAIAPADLWTSSPAVSPRAGSVSSRCGSPRAREDEAPISTMTAGSMPSQPSRTTAATITSSEPGRSPGSSRRGGDVELSTE